MSAAMSRLDRYRLLLDALCEGRRRPGWKPEHDRDLLEAIDDVFDALDERTQHDARDLSWRGWPEDVDARQHPAPIALSAALSHYRSLRGQVLEVLLLSGGRLLPEEESDYDVRLASLRNALSDDEQAIADDPVVEPRASDASGEWPTLIDTVVAEGEPNLPRKAG